MKKREFDEIDRKIMALLRADAASSKSEIARRAGVAASVVADRIKRLEANGVITGYQAMLDPRAFDFALLAYVFITERKPVHGFDTGRALVGLEWVEEVHKIAGEDCFMVKVRTRDTAELNALLGKISAIETVAGVRTSIVLGTIKEDTPLSAYDLNDAAE